MKGIKSSVKAIISAVIIVVVIGVSSVFRMLDNFLAGFAVINFGFTELVQLVLMVAFVLALAYLLQFILKSLKCKSKRMGTIVTVIGSLIRYVAAIVVICWGLTILGVSVSTVFAGVGILALIIGFGAESLIADVITGLFMLFENQCNVGDIVEVNGFRGTIRSIGIRTTAIADGGDNVKIINNSDMKNILNRSADMSRAVCDISISYEADLKHIESLIPGILDNIYKAHSDVMLESPIYLGVQTLGESAVTLRFVAMVKETDIYSAARILNHDLLLAWGEHGITVPYNQLDVHTC